MSKIEVNEIDAQSGSTITVGSACKSVAVPGNVVKSNALQASDGGNIVNQSGTTITLGASGDTVSLASGASQSGFGRAGSVDWQTGSIKTASSFTAASGEGYFVDTSSNAITANLPAGSAGAIVSFSDYARNFATNALTITPNGSEKIGGVAADAALNVDGQAATFVYVDSTKGWVNVQNAEDTEIGRDFISATGGTESTSGNCKIHTFTGPGTFCVSSISSEAPENIVSYLVVAGGGNGGAVDSNNGGGAGGGGGFREIKNPLTPYTASPLDGYPSSPNRVTITASPFPITVGGGGTNNSVFSTITSAGGGTQSANGGSGGGGSPVSSAGSGNTPPTSPPQGNNGGAGGPVSPPFPQRSGGGGGGAGGAGGGGSAGTGGTPGPSVSTSITGSSTAYSQGGGGANGNTSSGTCIGTANTGNGNGGRANPGITRTGGSGIVIIRYKFQ
jgi:hypothetical protein